MPNQEEMITHNAIFTVLLSKGTRWMKIFTSYDLRRTQKILSLKSLSYGHYRSLRLKINGKRNKEQELTTDKTRLVNKTLEEMR